MGKERWHFRVREVAEISWASSSLYAVRNWDCWAFSETSWNYSQCELLHIQAGLLPSKKMLNGWIASVAHRRNFVDTGKRNLTPFEAPPNSVPVGFNPVQSADNSIPPSSVDLMKINFQHSHLIKSQARIMCRHEKDDTFFYKYTLGSNFQIMLTEFTQY